MTDSTPAPPPDDLRTFEALEAIIRRLHGPEGCPWDREQTHESLRPHLIEEAYELLEAIDSSSAEAIAEELGDVLLQVLMHTAVGERLGEFELGDVVSRIAAKLIARHPHVFADATAETAEDVRASWEVLKQKERPDRPRLEGVPTTLPALAESQTIQGRARRAGFDWPDIHGPLEKLSEEIAELALAETEQDREEEFGDVLFVIAHIAQTMGVDGEQALRRANGKFRRRFGLVERWANEQSLDLNEMDIKARDELWERAKASERAQL